MNIFLITYGTLFIAELLGDALLYTSGILATRYRLAPMLAGAFAAYMEKMLAAVLLEELVAKLPQVLLAIVSTISFFGMALALWFNTPEERRIGCTSVPWCRAFTGSFAVIFFSEWGDVGQVTAAMMSERYHAPVVIWAAATLAMTTKATRAATFGTGVRNIVPMRILRPIGVGVMLTLGFFSALEVD